MTDLILDHFTLNGQTYAGSNTIQFTMDAAKDLAAVYHEAPTVKHNLTLSYADQYGNPVGGTVSPFTGTQSVPEGPYAVKAIPTAPYYYLDYWLVNGLRVEKSGDSITVNVTADTTVVAKFNQYVIHMASDAQGTTNPASPGDYLYNPGTSVNISATPKAGYAFDHWIVNDIAYTSDPLLLVVNEKKWVHAYYRAAPKVTLAIDHNSGGHTNPGRGTYTYNPGTSVTVRASPNSGHTFKSWKVDGKYYYTPSITIILAANTGAYATFS